MNLQLSRKTIRQLRLIQALDRDAEKRAKRAKKTSSKLLQGDQRKHAIGQVMDTLADWRYSQFENEAACRAGLRSAFCMQGHKWASADEEAAALVNEGFKRMGVKRPTWAEGQREYVTPEENCNWCGMELPEEMVSGSRKGRFCSSVCAKSALRYREFEKDLHDTAIGRSAYGIIAMEARPDVTCSYCETRFKPFGYLSVSAQKRRQFCSKACTDAAKTTRPMRACVCCDKQFRPDKDDRIFCSRKCYFARKQPARICVSCHIVFEPVSKKAIYCSKACGQRLARRSQKAFAPSNVITLVIRRIEQIEEMLRAA